MDFALTAAIAPRVIALETTPSTNDHLVALAGEEELTEFTVVATTSQTAGRGRLGRSWEAPEGTSLAASVLLRPHDAGLPLESYGWIPLIAGLAMTRAVRGVLPQGRATLKWPNDVLIEGRKVCGVLSELLSDGKTVVVGAGLNLTITRDALPVPTATSLFLEGVSEPAESLADRALSAYLSELQALWGVFTSREAGAGAGAIHALVSEACSTLGHEVRVDNPDGTHHIGTALRLDEAGRLSIKSATNSLLQTVAAGDITHLRYE